MIQLLTFLVVNLLLPTFLFAQWAHINGAQNVGTSPKYEKPVVGGAKSLLRARTTDAPYPGGLQYAEAVMDSTNSYIYVFGGTGNIVLTSGQFNDLWKYTIASNTWEHIIGNKTLDTPVNYDLPHPGGIIKHKMVIDSTDRYLYIFGGNTFVGSTLGYVNDVWKYDLVMNAWEHLSGNGIINSHSNYTTPSIGGIAGHTMVIDSTDRYLYVVGGKGYQDGTLGDFNNVWMYDLTTNTWTFLTGTQAKNSLADYTTPYPGSLQGHTMVIDSTNSYLYLFGGNGMSGTSSSSGTLNDVWKYDIVGNTWEHLVGSMLTNTDTDLITPYPGGLQFGDMVIDNTAQVLYYFGGLEYFSGGARNMNVMWKFNLTSNTWSFLSGNTTINVRCDYSVPYPGSVYSHKLIKDKTNSFIYLFGGYGYDSANIGFLNDVWTYQIGENVLPTTTNAISSQNSVDTTTMESNNVDTTTMDSTALSDTTTMDSTALSDITQSSAAHDSTTTDDGISPSITIYVPMVFSMLVMMFL